MIDLDKARAGLAAHAAEAVAWRHDLHRHPEVAYAENWTSAFLAEKLESFGLEVTRGLGRTGLVAVLKGGEGPTIGLRCDIDALTMDEANTFAHASENPGRMHACGHDGHAAMLLAAARQLCECAPLPGTLAFIFQPAEESEAGAKAMIDDGLFARFPMASVYGMHNWPVLREGTIATRVGPLMAAYDVFDIVIRARGIHAAMPHLGTDAVIAAGALASQVQSIVARAIDPLEGAVVSLTQIHGGDAYNVLPAEVRLSGCSRHFSPVVQDRIEERMRAICRGVAESFGLVVEIDYQRRYPVTSNSAAETAAALRAAERVVGAENVSADITPSMSSEDFGFFQQEKPGNYAWLGVGDARGGLHNPAFDFNDRMLETGAAYWVAVAEEGLAAARAL